MRIFWKKNVKIRIPVCLRRLETTTPEPRVVTPDYYHNFVKFVSSAKYVLLPSKENKITTIA